MYMAPSTTPATAATARASGSEWLAVEILGPHNAALNSQAPLGPARLKWQLLAARGYRVVTVDGWEWLRLGGPGTVAKQLYLQNLRNQLLVQGAAQQTAAAVAAGGRGGGAAEPVAAGPRQLNRPPQRR
jgi:hypothetical protein